MHYAPRGIASYRDGAPDKRVPRGLGRGRAGWPDDDELRDALEAVLDRLETTDDRVHAFLPEPRRRERVTAALAGLIDRYPDPAGRPALFGIPVGVKDIFRADGFETRAGSSLPPELFAGPQSEAVTRLRDAGAIVLGKTVTTEFAYYEPGPTRNPWNLGHTPGGSSSGSAAAVAAGYCPIALGTQTIGSINRPAAFCGVVGFKPSMRRVPTDGVVPFSVSADHVGLLAADVASAAAAAVALWNEWRVDDSNEAAFPASPGALSFLVADDVYATQANDDARAAVEAAVGAIERAGATVRRVPIFDRIADINDTHTRMVARDFADVHAVWVRDHEALYSERARTLIEIGRSVSDEELERARAGRMKLRSRIGELMDDHGATALLTPSSQSPAPHGIDSTGSPLLNLPWTYAGLPTVTLPAHVTREGLPTGVQLVGRFGEDERLVSCATPIERLLAFAGGRA